MGLFSKANERRAADSSALAAKLLSTTDNVSILAQAAKTSLDNWPAILENPHVPGGMLKVMEDLEGASQALLDTIRAHPNYPAA